MPNQMWFGPDPRSLATKAPPRGPQQSDQPIELTRRRTDRYLIMMKQKRIDAAYGVFLGVNSACWRLVDQVRFSKRANQAVFLDVK